MLKFWKLPDSKSNSLILIKDQTIYKGNPKPEDLKNLRVESPRLEFLNKIFSLSYSYIKRIENQEGKSEIKLFYGKDSEEELKIKDPHVKQEVFEFLKQDMTNFKYSKEFPSGLKYAKPQLFSLLFITGIFIWTIYLSIQIESGVEYEIVGGRAGISGLILGLANFGTIKVILGYVVLLAIILFALYRRLNSRSETEYLKRA
jgi:hypothetical protein